MEQMINFTIHLTDGEDYKQITNTSFALDLVKFNTDRCSGVSQYPYKGATIPMRTYSPQQFTEWFAPFYKPDEA